MKFFFLLFLCLLSSTALAEANLRFNPLSLLIRSYNLNLDLPVSDKWTIGPMGGVRNDSNGDSDFDVKSYTVGVRANYYTKTNVFQEGWYLGPSIRYTRVTVEKDFGGSVGEISGNANGIIASTLLGYQFFGQNKKFNVNIGLGPAFYMLNPIKVKNSQNNLSSTYSASSGLQLDGEISLGWIF